MKQVPCESSYIKFLPSIFHETALEGKKPLIERYLAIFEKILSGIDDEKLGGKKGLGEILNIVPELFHPRLSFLFEETNISFLPPLESIEPKVIKNYFGSEEWKEHQTDDFLNEFLAWLASWMALVLKEDWELEKKREVIARIIPIYRMRGTKKGIEELLGIYVGGDVEICEIMEFHVGGSKIGMSSRIGQDTLIGKGMRPHFFTVRVTFTKTDIDEKNRFLKNLKGLLNSEKPIHTNYLLTVITPTLQIGIENGSKIGINTLIGGKYTEIPNA